MNRPVLKTPSKSPSPPPPVDVLEGGERDTNDLLSCSHYPLKGLAAGRVAGAIPHSDAASQDALDGASVEGAHDGGRGSGSS